MKSFVDKADRRIVLVGGEGEAAEHAARSASPSVEFADDLAAVLARPPAERPDAVVIEAGAVAAGRS